jgi:hypothetical protein
MTVFEDTLSGSVTVTPAAEEILRVDGVLADTVTLSRTVLDLMSLREAISDSFTAADEPQERMSERAETAEAFSLTPVLVGTENVRLQERLRLGDTTAPAALFGQLMSESARIAERLSVGLTATVDELATVEATLAAAYGWLIAEELQIGDTLAALATYGATVAERVRFQAVLARFLGGDISETVQIAPTVVMNLRLSQTVLEAAGLSETLTPRLLFHVAAEETIGIDDTDLLQMIYNGTLQDGVSIEAMHLDPSGDVVTWCVNTRMGFVTQYKNYEFNSFAVIDGKYVGATDNGLFELHGDTDSNAQIIAGITGGILQMNSSKLHGLAGVYIGLRGTGEFYLKLTAGSGEEYVYKVTARDMETTKVNIGKGLRHRYLSYSLENVGQDFELESIEFVPMRGFRRV